MQTKPAHPVERLLSVAEAADVLGVSYQKTWRLIYSGALPTVRIGRRRLIAPDDIRAFISAHRTS